MGTNFINFSCNISNYIGNCSVGKTLKCALTAYLGTDMNILRPLHLQSVKQHQNSKLDYLN